MTLAQFIDSIKELLIKNRLSKVFELMNQHLTDEAKHEIGLILLKSQVRRVEFDKLKGIITQNTALVTFNQMSDNLLGIIKYLEDSDLLNEDEIDERDILHYILVITDKKREEDFKNLLNSLRFKNIKFANSLDIEQAQQFDLVIFDNMDLPNKRQLTDEEKATITAREKVMKTCIDNTKQFIIHYGNYLNLINYHRDRIQSANSQFSLYARVKEVINFMEAYSD